MSDLAELFKPTHSPQRQPSLNLLSAASHQTIGPSISPSTS